MDAAKGARGKALGLFPAGREATPGEVSGRKHAGRGAVKPRRKAPIKRPRCVATPALVYRYGATGGFAADGYRAWPAFSFSFAAA